MNEQERDMIQGLFKRLEQAEQQSGPRDQEAEALIREQVADNPAAPYLLAQVVLVQEQGMRNLQNRVEQLEKDLSARAQPQSDGSFLGGMFGGTEPATARAQGARPAASGWQDPSSAGAAAARKGKRSGAQGSGFMAGAMQTAMGVAGGVLIANAVAGMFAGEAEAAAPAAEAAADEPDASAGEDMGAAGEDMDAGGDEGGGLFDGLFGDDDWGF